jgi:hypothetical protein
MFLLWIMSRIGINTGGGGEEAAHEKLDSEGTIDLLFLFVMFCVLMSYLVFVLMAFSGNFCEKIQYPKLL